VPLTHKQTNIQASVIILIWIFLRNSIHKTIKE
jgi:hypothetical protein